jgi:CRP/FNR family transcriptional regulator, nitrogen oxide reductase regulator
MVPDAPGRPSIDLFDGFADHEIRELLQRAQSRRVAANTVLFSEGRPAPTVHVLIVGYVRMVQTTPNGARIIIRYVKPGEMFGISALLDRLYPADAIAATECVELQWPAEMIKDFVLGHPRAALNVFRDVESRLRETESRLKDLSTAPVEQRIAHALTRLVEKVGEHGPEGVEIPFPISRQDLADMVGTTLHTVSRTLGMWDAQGRVKRGRCRIIVTDAASLAQIGNQVAPSELHPRRTHRRTRTGSART